MANMSRELFELIHYEPPVARWPVEAGENRLIGCCGR